MLPASNGPWGLQIRVKRQPDTHRTPQAAPKLNSVDSKLELSTLLQSRLYPLAQDTQAAAHGRVEMAVTITEADQRVGHVERRNDGNAIQAHDFAAVTDFAHLGVQELGGV